MAINFLNTIDLNKNSLNNARIQNLGSNPSTADSSVGQIYYNTTAQALKIYKEILPATVPKTYEWVEVGSDSVEAGDGIGVTFTGGNVIVRNTGLVSILDGAFINLSKQGGGDNTELTADLSAVDGAAAASERYLTKNNKWATVASIIGTTYDLTTAPTGTAIRLTGSNSTDDDVTISGTAGQTAITRIDASELRVKLTDDVTIVDDLTVGGVIDQQQDSSGDPVEKNSFAAILNMNTNKIENVGTGTVGTDGVNLGQVELLVAGIGVFQGSYNASTEPGVPIISGASNIALDQGDYFVVSVAGSLLGQALEPGDFIFADGAIAAGSSPVAGDYTFVIADANIAGSGATDGATQKGVAGFDSATFDVSANGWVQLKPQANPYGAAVTLTSGSDSGGETTFTVDITALFGAGALAANCKAEVVTVTGRQTVYPDITGNGVGSLDFKFIPVVADSVYKALITIV
jgi:hypothetical protein